MGLLLVLAAIGIGAVGAWGLFMGPIGRAVGRWIEARTPHAQGQLMADLAELEARVTRMERLLRDGGTAPRARRWPRAPSD